jgi:hypothetical protein
VNIINPVHLQQWLTPAAINVYVLDFPGRRLHVHVYTSKYGYKFIYVYPPSTWRKCIGLMFFVLWRNRVVFAQESYIACIRMSTGVSHKHTRGTYTVYLPAHIPLYTLTC